MKSNLQRILQKIIAAADDSSRPPILTEIMDLPVLADRELVDLLGSWIVERLMNTPVNSVDQLIGNDATIIFPDLDNPGPVEEYYQWIQNQSKCYRMSGEGDAPEAIFGQYGVLFFAVAQGIIPEGELQAEWVERNETPVILPGGVDKLPQSIARLIAIPPSMATGLDEADLANKTAYEIRMAICKAKFLNVPDLPTAQHNARSRFLEGLTEKIIDRVNEGSSKYYEWFGYKPKFTSNGVPLGLTPFGQVHVENMTNNLLGQISAACSNTIIQFLMGIPNLMLLTMNSYFEFWQRRTNQLLSAQTRLYISLIQHTWVCSQAPSFEEREKCKACGTLIEKPMPAPPTLEPLGVGCTDPLNCPPDDYRESPLFPRPTDPFEDATRRRRP